MGGKARVHELAKELGVPTKEVLRRLAEQGHWVKSASSTVDSRIARQLREHYSSNAAPRRIDGNNKPPPKRPSPSPLTHASPVTGGQRRLTSPEIYAIRQRFRGAVTHGQDKPAIEKLYLKCAAQYGVSQVVVRDLVAEDLFQHPEAYTRPRPPREGRATTQHRDNHRPPAPSNPTPIDTARQRPRAGNLPPCTGIPNPHIVEALITKLDTGQADPDTVSACVHAFTADTDGNYGYLAWRYQVAYHFDPTVMSPHQHLARIAHVVAAEAQLFDDTIRHHGPFLDQPALASRLLETTFRDLTDDDDVGRSAADELRRTRARDGFLRCAVLLSIASPHGDQRLWEMLEQLRPPTPEQLVETSAPLASAIMRLDQHIAHVEKLLIANESAIAEFFRRARNDLIALDARRYGFLEQFLEVNPTTAPTLNELPFALLPSGEKLTAFLNNIRSTGSYLGAKVDEQRLAVLEQIEQHFGPDRCQWHAGTEASNGVNNQYLVLTIKAANTIGPHAVAISPLAGLHATYVVRSDCADADWAAIFATTKSEARMHGARKLLFTATGAGIDEYQAMRDKVIALLECPRHEFQKQRQTGRSLASGV